MEPPPASPEHPLLAHPLITLGRFAFPPAPSPDDEASAARDRRWASRTILVATLFLLVFNAGSVSSWARRQPPGWGTDTVRRLSEVWIEQTALLGADRPRAAVRGAYEQARDQRFVGAATPPGR